MSDAKRDTALRMLNQAEARAEKRIAELEAQNRRLDRALGKMCVRNRHNDQPCWCGGLEDGGHKTYCEIAREAVLSNE